MKKTGKDEEWTQEFWEKLQALDDELQRYDIRREEVVIVNGASLEAMGIRECGDVDIIISTDARKKVGVEFGKKTLNNTVEILPANQYKILDDEIVCNDRYFVTINGYQFIQPIFMLRNRKPRSFIKRQVRYDTWLMIKYLLSKRFENGRKK